MKIENRIEIQRRVFPRPGFFLLSFFSAAQGYPSDVQQRASDWAELIRCLRGLASRRSQQREPRIPISQFGSLIPAVSPGCRVSDTTESDNIPSSKISQTHCRTAFFLHVGRFSGRPAVAHILWRHDRFVLASVKTESNAFYNHISSAYHISILQAWWPFGVQFELNENFKEVEFREITRDLKRWLALEYKSLIRYLNAPHFPSIFHECTSISIPETLRST